MNLISFVVPTIPTGWRSQPADDQDLTLRDQFMRLKKTLCPNVAAGPFTGAGLLTAIGFPTATGHAGVDQSLQFIAENFSRQIQFGDLLQASVAGLRAVAGRPLQDFPERHRLQSGAFLRTVRIEYAKQLLVEQDLKPKQIAARCAYWSENTFCVAFLRAMKTSPKRFQRQYWACVACDRHPPREEFTTLSRLLLPIPVGDIPECFNPAKNISLHALLHP